MKTKKLDQLNINSQNIRRGKDVFFKPVRQHPIPISTTKIEDYKN